MITPAVIPNPDKLSGGDMSALVETYQHLKQANDPRADKLAAFIGSQVRSGNVEPLDSSNPDHAPALYGFTLPNIAKNLYAGGKSVVTGAYDLGKDIVSNPNWVTGPNSTYEKFIGAPAAAEAQKASQAYKQGHYSEAAGHELAGAIPLVGPAAAQIGEQAGSGDVGGAAAKGVAQAATGPLLLKGGGLLRDATAPLARSVAERAYQSALKPSTTNSPVAVDSMVNTGLQNAIPVSEAGATKLSGLIDDLNSKIKAEVSSRPATVNKFAVASRLADTAKRFQTQVNPEADLNSISESGNEFLRNQPAQIPATDAQAIKQGTYQQLKDKSYGEMQTATKEAQKALARGIKEELNQQFPELAKLNAQDTKLYQLDGALEKAVQRQSNHQLIGLGTPAAATAGGLLTGSGVGAMAGALLKAVVDDPVVKSRMAILLSRVGNLPIPKATARVAAYSTALGAASRPADDRTSGQ